MAIIGRLVCAASIALSVGCSADSVKQTVYETVQNARERECLKNLGTGCENEKRDSYDDYEHKRKELGQPH